MSQQPDKLFMAMELSKGNWRLCFGDGKRERQRTVPAGQVKALLGEVAKAKEKFGLAPDAQVASCYEAGRDGFWIDRMLRGEGIGNVVVDPASIEVPRRARHRKTDRLDAARLLKLLLRAVLWGEGKVFSPVAVPDEAQEARMRIGRERERLVKERSGHLARMRSLCALHGASVGDPEGADVDGLRDWAGKALPPEVSGELRREQARLRLLGEQVRSLEAEQAEALARAGAAAGAKAGRRRAAAGGKGPEPTAADRKAAKLGRLKAVGLQSSWLLANEVFGWRTFPNRRAVGSFAGLTGTPYDSGETLREQGISKAGSRRVRAAMVELAWMWVRHQPASALTRWFVERYVSPGSKRSRRKGIVALARKLLVALWKYVERDVVPEGALLKA